MRTVRTVADFHCVCASTQLGAVPGSFPLPLFVSRDVCFVSALRDTYTFCNTDLKATLNLSNTFIQIQSVPRSKHTASWLLKPVS